MKAKIFRTNLFITMLVLVICSSVIIGLLYNFFESDYTQELRNEANYISSSIEIYGMEYIEKIDFDNVRISYIQSDGTVTYDNKANIAQMENHSQREEFKEALQFGEGSSIRLSDTLSEKTYYISRKLSNGDVIRISDTRISEWALIKKLFFNIILVVLLSVLLSVVFSRRLAKGVVEPINRIDLSCPENQVVYEEISPLITRIREQQKEIQDQMELLKKERKSFSQITKNMSEGFIVIDQSTNMLSSNSAASGLLNCSDGVLEGSVFQLNRSEEFIKSVESALSGKHEAVILEVDRRFINVFVNPVYEHEEVIGALLLMMDVTEKEGRDALRREFTANVSHELKTPLTSIFAAAEMMKNGMVKDEDIKAFSEKIYNEAQRLINLMNDIIKLSRLDEGSSKLEFTKCDGAIIVHKAVNALKERADKKNITLSEEISGAELSCIPHLLEEMTHNLLSNAIKYTNPGGKVKVSFKKDDKITLTVSDTGIGIPKNEQERIFERFYRVDRSHTKAIEGTGLGLSIVKHGAIIHGAKIELESEEGMGSIFRIIFPQ